MRVSCTARSNLAGSLTNPGANPYMSTGMAICTTATKTSSVHNNTLSACSAKARAASFPSVSTSPANRGTKAAAKAPSANRRRNRLGNLKATKNTSATGPAPRMAAIRMSRANPRTRLTMVRPPTVAMERRRTMGVV